VARATQKESHLESFRKIEENEKGTPNLPSLSSGELMMTRLETRVEKPGARHDCAIKPNLSSFRQTAWSSRRQSQPNAQIGVLRGINEDLIKDIGCFLL